eukprot:35013-Rhodomonas_salina.2
MGYACCAMSGTDLGYAATRFSTLSSRSSIHSTPYGTLLSPTVSSYAMPGTDVANAAIVLCNVRY